MNRFSRFILDFLEDKTWIRLAEIGIGYNFKTLKDLLRNSENKKEFLVIDMNQRCLEKLEKDVVSNRINTISSRADKKILKNYVINLIYSIRPNPELIPDLKLISKNKEVPLFIRPFSLDGYRNDLELINYEGLPILKYPETETSDNNGIDIL